jgi:hypothetical protein
MALKINTLSEIRIIDRARSLHVLEINSSVVKWLSDNVGDLISMTETYYLTLCHAIHYRGVGWQIEPPDSVRLEKGYRVTIINDTLALQFKLTWL